MWAVDSIRCQPSVTQIKMLALAAQGKTREEIGRILFLSPNTVKNYLADVREMLSARNNTHAVALCIVYGHLVVDGETHQVSAPELELAA